MGIRTPITFTPLFTRWVRFDGYEIKIVVESHHKDCETIAQDLANLVRDHLVKRRNKRRFNNVSP